MEPRADPTPLYLAATVDLQRAVDWLADTNAQRPAPERLLLAALFLRAVITALRDVPELNRPWAPGARPCPDGGPVHLAVAVGHRAGGLATVVVPEADRLDLDALMRTFREGVARLRRGETQPNAPRATFTVTSLGDQGAQAVFPSIVPPQVAGVGFGRVTEQPSAVAGAIVCSPVVTATLAADQRVTDSHRGSRFLALLDDRLQHPEAL
jgi:pyruvate dehydrogenase E2 component (dihydrolipoamide acetyltransferase)